MNLLPFLVSTLPVGPPPGQIGDVPAEAPSSVAPPFVAVPLDIINREGETETITTTCGSPEKNWILEVNGGGIAIGDFDGEGSNDLVIVDGSTLERFEAGEAGLPPRLFLNDGAANFREAGESFQMAGGRWGTGAATGDVDNDGDLDLVVLEWGPDRLFLNEDGKGFQEATEGSGLKGKLWSTSGAFLDFDEDGALDLAIASYLKFDTESIPSREDGACEWKGYAVMCGPENLIEQRDALYRGGGDGTFTDAYFGAGLLPEVPGFGLGITTVDYDADGDTDLYVTNDSTPNYLWQNQGDGKFVEKGDLANVALNRDGREQAGMGIGVGDIDGDGLADLLVTNFSGESNALYMSRRSKRKNLVNFKDKAHQRGLFAQSLHRLGWGAGFLDADLDGVLDAFVLNGHVYPQADQSGTDTTYAQQDDFYRGEGDRFDVLALHDAGPLVGRAGAAADLDGDGRPEIVALRQGTPVQILRNGTSGGHWLEVRAVGTRSNRDGIGARVIVSAGERNWYSEIRTAGGFQAAIPAVAHFGLGDLETLDRVRVEWTSGQVAEATDVRTDQRLVLEEPAGEVGSSEGDKPGGDQ